jgi:phosphosulfolactate synthase (CoM biosynthesis protein A)
MNDYIKQCVNSRVDFFDKYYTVPIELKPEVEAFINEINQLGDAATDAVDFENKFASSKLSERFNSLLTRCIPKAYNMTNEEKQHSKETAKEIFKEDRSRIIKEAVADVADYASVMMEEEVIAKSREVMIEEGVFDEYTKASNAADIITESGSFLKNLFKKKK